MGKIKIKIKIFIATLIAALLLPGLASCTAASKAPSVDISSGWEFDHLEGRSSNLYTWDFSIEDLPRFIYYSDDYVIFHMSGLDHVGRMTPDDNGGWEVSYIDTEKLMYAHIEGDRLYMQIEGSKATFIFNAAEEKAMLPAIEEPADDDIEARLIGEWTVEFTNSGEEDYTFGSYYRLELLRDGTWYIASTDVYVAFTMEAYLLPAGETMTMDYSLEHYGELSPGEYRIACGMTDYHEGIHYAYFTVAEDGTVTFEEEI